MGGTTPTPDSAVGFRVSSKGAETPRDACGTSRRRQTRFSLSGAFNAGTDVNTQQSFEQLNQRAVGVVVDPIQSVRGRVVMDCFRLIHPNTLVMGEGAQLLACAAALEVQFFAEHRRFASFRFCVFRSRAATDDQQLGVSKQTDADGAGPRPEPKLLLHFHLLQSRRVGKPHVDALKPQQVGRRPQAQGASAAPTSSVCADTPGAVVAFGIAAASVAACGEQDFAEHGKDVCEWVKSLRELSVLYRDMIVAEEKKDAEALLVERAGKIDAKQRIQSDLQRMLGDALIMQSLGTMVSTLVF